MERVVAKRRFVLSSTALLAVGLCVAVVFVAPGLSPGQGGAPSPSLEQVDGGANYYNQFANPVPSFPIGVWGAYDQTQANIDIDKGMGINLYVWPADTSIPMSRFEANGMDTLLTPEWYGVSGVASSPANAGYVLDDEVDMRYSPQAGFAVMQAANDAAPKDNRARYANYGKGVLFPSYFGNSNADAERYVNDFQQLVSSDVYWFTDPYQYEMISPSWLPEGEGTPISGTQVRRAANYGYQIDQMQALDAADGQRKPIWGVVELGWPFGNTEHARTIAPAEVRAAVWHSIIAGARGIVYFNHSLGGPCPTHHVLRTNCGNYPAVQAAADETNALIQQLAPTLNSPTVTSGFTHSGSIRAMVKWQGGHFYVFAGSRDDVSSTGTVSIPCVGDATAVRLGESGSVPVSGGSFSDSFADGNAIHIYRINGGSTCGLPGSPPPAGSPPPNGFSFGKLKRNLKKGTAKLTVEVSAPGALRLKRTGGVRGSSKHPAEAGRVRLKIGSRGKAKRKLKRVSKHNRTSKVKVKARVSYTPTGGEPSEKSKRVKLKRRARR
jgi:hypothetical protein